MVALTWPQEPTESSRPASPCSKSRDPSWAVPGTRRCLLGSQPCSGNPCPLPLQGQCQIPGVKLGLSPSVISGRCLHQWTHTIYTVLTMVCCRCE